MSFVLATGALAPLLARKLGIRLPIIPGKGYNLTAHNTQNGKLKRPVYMVEKKVVATPWSNGFRLGSTMEFTGYNLDLTKSRLEALKRASTEYLDIDLEGLKLTPWAGWRPMKDNGIPIIERNNKVKNLILAAGHSMLGLSMATGTGYTVKEILEKKD